jgi:dynein heavy chain, axonemal
MHQQLSMPKVRRIIQILRNVKENQELYNVETFHQKEKEFKKEHAVARDFVKFLLTLERQFKNIGKGDLKSIEDTMPSLLNGLKLIWTISRHINHQVDEFQDIIEAISNEIC